MKVIENIIISNSDLLDGDRELIFQDEEVYFTETIDLPTLLVELGIYKSKGDARKAGRTGVISTGYSEVKASKIRRFYIWNPKIVLDKDN